MISKFSKSRYLMFPWLDSTRFVTQLAGDVDFYGSASWTAAIVASFSPEPGQLKKHVCTTGLCTLCVGYYGALFFLYPCRNLPFIFSNGTRNSIRRAAVNGFTLALTLSDDECTANQFVDKISPLLKLVHSKTWVDGTEVDEQRWLESDSEFVWQWTKWNRRVLNIFIGRRLLVSIAEFEPLRSGKLCLRR